MLADGRLHLSAIALLAPHLTAQNRDALLARATHKTKRQIEELVAEIAPRPDAPAVIRKLPERWTLPVALPSVRSATPSSALRCGSPPEPFDTVGPSGPQLRLDEVASNGPGGAVASFGGVVPSSDKVVASSGRGIASSGSVPAAATMGPLSPGRYKVQFTASAELRDKLERLQALMRSSVPDGDLAAIIDVAVTDELETLEARRFARTRRPRKTLADTDTSPRTREIPAAVKRSVGARDEGRCAYVDEHGWRCAARVGLQFHHRHTFATGGDHSPANVSLQCAGHNLYLAEIDFGRGAIAAHTRRQPSRSGKVERQCDGPGAQVGQCRLYSRENNPRTGRRRNLGTFATREAAGAHERAVQYFKRRRWGIRAAVPDGGGA
jgi:hypothetical protein